MNKALLLLILLFSEPSFSQSTNERSYGGINGLAIIDSITVNEITGRFTVSDGFGGYDLLINDNYTYLKRSLDCYIKSNVDTGKWSIKKGSHIILSSRREKFIFTLFRFDQFYFLITSSQAKNFLSDITSARSELKYAKPFTTDNKTYSADFLVAFMLKKKYYGKEISD